MTSDGKFYVRRMAESSTLRLTAIKKPNELSCLPCYFRIVGHASREVSCSPMLACDGESLHRGGWRGLGDNRITRRMDSEGVHTRALCSAVISPISPYLQYNCNISTVLHLRESNITSISTPVDTSCSTSEV